MSKILPWSKASGGGSATANHCTSAGVGRRADAVVANVYQGVVGHRYRAPARVAAGVSERKKLFEKNLAQAGLLAEFALGRRVERFVNLNEPARQCPRADERPAATLDEKHLEVLVVEPENNTIDG